MPGEYFTVHLREFSSSSFSQFTRPKVPGPLLAKVTAPPGGDLPLALMTAVHVVFAPTRTSSGRQASEADVGENEVAVLTVVVVVVVTVWVVVTVEVAVEALVTVVGVGVCVTVTV